MAEVPALEISHLRKTFSGVTVVNDLNLAIAPGEILGLLGPNGAGKSTTINLISGVARMEQGGVRVFGHDNLTQYRETRRLVGVMHQEIIIDPFFKIGTALQIHSGYYGVSDDPKWRNLLIEKLALGPHLHKSMNKLSGGMKRRFMVAKALIHKPRLLILDEPTAGVDVGLRRDLWDFVREINRQGTTVLLTTHYLEEAEQMCGRIAIMNLGELIAMDTTENLMKRVEKKKLVFTLSAPPGDLPEGVRRLGPLPGTEGTLVFPLSREEDAGEVIRAVVASGLPVSGLETISASLEDVFFKLTAEGNYG